MKKYSKILVLSVLCLTCLFGQKDVNAKETNIVYTNSNGVSFTQEEYDFFTRVYWDGYQKNMTQDVYNEYEDLDFLNAEFDSKTVYDVPKTRGTYFSSNYKSIKISKICDDNCRIAVVATWLVNPNIRSFDVIGAYLSGTTLQSTPNTRVVSSTQTKVALNIKKQEHGFGTSVLLPDTGDNVKLNQDFYVAKGGYVYASYQHAVRNATLTTSQKFNISGVGFGGVFSFYDEAYDVYDDMPGVDIQV